MSLFELAMEASPGRLREEIPNLSQWRRSGGAAQGDLLGCLAVTGLGSNLERPFPPWFSTPTAGMEGLAGFCVSTATCGEYLQHFYKGDEAELMELSPAGWAL